MRLYIACIALLLSLALIAHADDDSEYTRRSLRGLQGVAVIVEPLGTELERVGFTTGAIQTDVELKLRVAGIPVLKPKSRGGWLRVSIEIDTSAVPKWPFIIRVEMREVTLGRDPSIIVPFVRTWYVEAFGVVPISQVPSLRDDVKDQVDKFINAYLSVNPKK